VIEFFQSLIQIKTATWIKTSLLIICLKFTTMTLVSKRSLSSACKSLYHHRYDFNHVGYITKDEVRLILSHVPVEKSSGIAIEIERKELKETKNEIKEEYRVRAESQEEVNALIEKCFNKKLILSFEDFAYIIDHIDSGMFLCLLSLLKVHFPSLSEFMHYNQTHKDDKLIPHLMKHRLATSKMLSRFSPVSELAKTSIIRPVSVGDLSSSKKYKSGEKKDLISKREEFIVPAVRLPNAKQNSTEVTLSPSHFLAQKDHEDQLLFCQCGRQISDVNILQCDFCLKQEQLLKCEGFLYTKPKKGNKLKKFWYILDRRVMYSYTFKTDKAYKKMRNLAGYFIKEESTERFEDRTLAYCFTLVHGNTVKRKYMCASKDEYEKWCKVIKESIGYSNLSSYYEMKVRV